jgi:hypothetical protein
MFAVAPVGVPGMTGCSICCPRYIRQELAAAHLDGHNTVLRHPQARHEHARTLAGSILNNDINIGAVIRFPAHYAAYTPAHAARHAPALLPGALQQNRCALLSPEQQVASSVQAA